MTQKELRKLGSKRLLELITKQTENANRLEQENEQLKKRIANREQHLARMGEMAKSILQSGGGSGAVAAITAGDHPVTVVEPPEPMRPQRDRDEPSGSDMNKDGYGLYSTFHAAVREGERGHTPIEGRTDVPEGLRFTLKDERAAHGGIPLEERRLADEVMRTIGVYADGINKNRDEYRIYKVFNAAVSGSGISYTLVDGKSDVPKDSHFTLKNGRVAHDGITLEDGRLTDEDMRAIAAYVDGDRPYKTVPITGGDSEAISVDPGYYYITSTDGSVAMVISTNPDAVIVEEVEAPAVAMAVSGGGDAKRNADEGGNIMIQAGAAALFVITIDVKKGARNYRLIDTIDKRLRHEGSRITVYTIDRNERWTVLDAQYWFPNWAAADPERDILTVAFYWDDAHRGAIPADVAKIIVAYDAVAGDGLVDGAANSARVEYNRMYTPDSTVRVYNAQITVSKVTETGEGGQGAAAPLAGARFALGKDPTGDGGYKSYYAYDRAAGKVSWTDTLSKAAVIEANMGMDRNQARFTGLEAGTYYLIEKDAPAGYLKTGDMKFEVKDGDYGTWNLAREADVINSAGARLPSAAGSEVHISTAAGGFRLTLGPAARRG